jgi:hypothetical protein
MTGAAAHQPWMRLTRPQLRGPWSLGGVGLGCGAPVVVPTAQRPQALIEMVAWSFKVADRGGPGLARYRSCPVPLPDLPRRVPLRACRPGGPWPPAGQRRRSLRHRHERLNSTARRSTHMNPGHAPPRRGPLPRRDSEFARARRCGVRGGRQVGAPDFHDGAPRMSIFFALRNLAG